MTNLSNASVTKTFRAVLTTALAIAVVTAFAACSNSEPVTPEDHVKALMAEIETALEQRNLSDVFEHVSENYQDHRGNNKQGLRKIAQIYTLRNKGISIVSSLNSISTLNESTVAVEASLLLGAHSDNDNSLLPQLSADSQRISAVFGLEDNAWKLVSMSWKGHSAY